MMKNIHPIKLRVFIATSLIVLWGMTLYLNFNAPVLFQVLANKFYEPVNIGIVKQNNFSCIRSNCVQATSIFNQNKGYCSGNGVSKKYARYTYNVDNKEYRVIRQSYIFPKFNCPPTVVRAYYFPLFPSWSVTNNNPPPEKHWEMYIDTTNYMLISLSFYILIVFFTIGKSNKIWTIPTLIKQDSKAHMVLFAVFLPTIIGALLVVLNPWQILSGLNINFNSAYEGIVQGVHITIQALSVCLPSFLLFCKRFSEFGKWRYLISLFLTSCVLYISIFTIGTIFRYLVSIYIG